MTNELQKIKNENTELKEKLQNYIPRRRVRRVYKQLKAILEEDLKNENKQYIEKLKRFINEIERVGVQTAGKDIKQAIEHLLSIVDIVE